MGEFSESFGVVRTRDLHEHGLSKNKIEAMVANGSLQRLRVGWFAEPTHDRDVAAAVAAGGCVSCLAALDKYGVWVAPQWLDDLAAAALGYRTIRLSYQTVMNDWDQAFAQILTLIRRGEHMRKPKVPAQFPIYGEASAI